MLIPQELKDLNDIIPENIYIVGGYVRDSLLLVNNKNIKDIDICGSFDFGVYASILKNCGFIVKCKNKALGVYYIQKNDINMEYARFRKEEYKIHGRYFPDKVEFVCDIDVDAKRRDFSINCLYYSLKEDKIIDFYNGQEDLKNETIKTIEEPEFVFLDDATRILRMIRFACKLNFNIDKETYSCAKTNAYKLKLLDSKILLKELNKILFECNNNLYLDKENCLKIAKKYIKELDLAKFIDKNMFLNNNVYNLINN